MSGGQHYFWLGASADAEPALAVPAEPVSRLDPTGIDPLREKCTHSFSLCRLHKSGMFWECTACGATFA